MAEEVVYEDMTVEELRDELSNRGLPVGGNKGTLVERLDEDDAVATGGTVPEAGPEPEEAPDYASDSTIEQALALEEPLRALSSSLPSGDGVDALKAAVRNAAHGIAHIRKTLDINARLAER